MRHVILALLLVPTSAFAEPISMVCKGSWYGAIDGKGHEIASSGSIIVDLDAKTAVTTWGTYDIVTIKENYIGLLGFVPANDKKPTGKVTGGVDRLSGEMDLMTSFNDGKSYEIVQQYKCTRANPLF